MNLRQITIKDQLELKKVYFDSIQSLDEKIYSQEQKRAWSSQAWNNSNFDNSITSSIKLSEVTSFILLELSLPFVSELPISIIFSLYIINWF